MPLRKSIRGHGGTGCVGNLLLPLEQRMLLVSFGIRVNSHLPSVSRSHDVLQHAFADLENVSSSNVSFLF